MQSEFMSEAMKRISSEFPQCLLFTENKTVVRLDSKTNTVLETKLLRLVLIQDIARNYQHAAIIVEWVGAEYVDYPQLIAADIEKLSKQIYVGFGNVNITRNVNDNSRLVFTKSLFLYTKGFDVDFSDIHDHFRRSGFHLVIRDDRYWKEYWNNKQPDAFICHDSRDKDSFVRPLFNELSRRLVKVWYDESSLSVGDSIIDKIDEGLRQCKFGIIVISENFLTRKKWTHREFKSLTSKELDTGDKVILPIWLGVTKERVAEYSIDLADKFALDSK